MHDLTADGHRRRAGRVGVLADDEQVGHAVERLQEVREQIRQRKAHDVAKDAAGREIFLHGACPFAWNTAILNSTTVVESRFCLPRRGFFSRRGGKCSERQAHLIPDDAAVGGFRHALAHEAELRVVVHEPVLAREHEAAAALRARIGDGALDELPRVAVPAVVGQRVHAEDHLPRAVRVVQRGVRVEVVREVGAVRDHAVHERDERAAVKQQPEVVAVVRQTVCELLPRRGLRRREARRLHRRHGVEIGERRRANHPSIHRYASVSSSSSAASSATVRQ